MLVVWGVGLAAWLAPASSSAVPPPGAPNCQVFPKNDVWHSDISHLPVNRHSTQWLKTMNAGSTDLTNVSFNLNTSDPDVACVTKPSIFRPIIHAGGNSRIDSLSTRRV